MKKNQPKISKKQVANNLENYQNLNKGFKISNARKKNYILEKSLLALSLPVLSFTTGFGQCMGPANGGNNIVLSGTASYPFDLNNDGVNDAKVQVGQAGGGSLYLSNIAGGAGVSFYVISNLASASVALFANNATISGATQNSTSAFLAYGDGNNGVLQPGNTGNIGFTAGGVKGFIRIEVVASTANSYTVRILERGTDSDGGTTLANNCASLGVVAPVELISFTQRTNKNSVDLKWATATEINNAGFEVERSTNGKDFQSISFVDGKGTTNDQQEYAFNDAVLKKGQLYYYRLKQIDFDGQFEYSEVITAKLADKGNSVTFFPNPAVNGQTVLSYQAIQEGILSIQVYNASGKALFQQNQLVVKGENALELNFSDLGPGMFFVKLEQNGQSSYQKLILK